MYRQPGENSKVFQDIKSDGYTAKRSAAAVCVIDPDEATRKLIAALLANDAFVVQTYRTVAEFRAETNIRPDCLLIDFEGLGMSIPELVQMLEQRSGCAIPVVVVGPDSVGTAVHCMKAGASDCIAKPLDEEALLGCIRRLCALGRINRAKATHITAAKAKLASLTEREKQVLDLVIDGRTNRAVADELNISGRTAEHYRARIKSKFEAKHLVDVVHTALIAMQSVPTRGQNDTALRSDEARFRRHHRSVRPAACAHLPEQAA